MHDSAVWVYAVYADISIGLCLYSVAPFSVLYSHVHTHKSLVQRGVSRGSRGLTPFILFVQLFIFI